MVGNLYFTIGLPRSGKSTFAAQWRSHPNRVVICGDSFRKALHQHAYLPEAEGFVFASMDMAVRALLHDGYDVLIDETATTPETITRYLKISPTAVPIFVLTPVGECINRAKAAGMDYLIGPIQRMSDQLDGLLQDWDNTLAYLQNYVVMRKKQDVTV
jgi:predicted kinase